MRTNIAIIRDHSGSMGHLASPALRDYNSILRTLKESSVGDSFLTVVECKGSAILKERNLPLHATIGLSTYHTSDNTPLYDSINMAINELSTHDGDGVANLLMVITDGEENASREINAGRLKQKITDLQATDRWTFTFRVPRGYGTKIIFELGLHSGNVITWEQNEESLNESSKATAFATQSYFATRATGKTSVNTFYANPADVSGINTKLDDLSKKYDRYTITPHQDGISIKDFCTEKTGKYELGRVYYSLNKAEKVQPNKDIIIRNTATDEMYGGHNARTLLSLPTVGDIRLAPGNMGKYEVYVRSTSNNRKLYAYNNVLVRK
jgi:hypothetical protein